MLVFQYGSNTLLSRINAVDRLNGAAVPLTLARTVEPWRLVFDVQSRSNGCGAASLTPGGAAGAWGRLYEIPPEFVLREKARPGRRCLDEIEGQGNTYRRIEIAVRRVDTGSEVRATTYVSKCPAGTFAPSATYLGYIVAGLAECGAPAEYIDAIRRAGREAEARRPA